MDASRIALTARLKADVALTSLLSAGPNSILQEDTFVAGTPLPCVILAYDHGEPHEHSPYFETERWNVWVVTSAADYYTLARVARAVRTALNRTSLDDTTGGGAAALLVEWVWSGQALADPENNLHAQMQRYWVLRQS